MIVINEKPIIKLTSEFESPSIISTPENDPHVESKSMIGNNDLLDVNFLETGANIQKAVGKVITHPSGKFASGFLVSPSLFMTNNHVLPTIQDAEAAEFQFNYQLDIHGSQLPVDTFHASIDLATRFFYTNDVLDYTIIRLAPNNGNPGNKHAFIKLKIPNIALNDRCNIIQHPLGVPKKVALRDSIITNIFEKVIRYTSDTETSSSGSPVFDDSWNLIAIHRGKGAVGTNASGQSVYINNEGIRIQNIILHLKNYLTTNNRTNIIAELGL